MSSETRRAVLVFAVLALVYFWGLSKSGMLGPDEPRYSAIGREMAHSGDWVTPRLWGSPWFEKPPLLYWTTAAATLAGLGPDLAPRVPVAFIGFAFLIFFHWFVRREFGPTEAFYATAILGTSAGWLAFSIVGVTDIPLSATFCAALLLSMLPGAGFAAAAGALLGLAVLAKGLVPLVLIVPVAWFARKRPRDLAIIGAACLLVALPWYVLVMLRNGRVVFDELIWKHHFQRFVSDDLKHVQKWWFYLPVLLAGVFPWIPALVLCRPRFFTDQRMKFIGLWLLYALLFFSASRNKLPGYILPLLPPLALIIGVSVTWARRTRVPLAMAAFLVGLVPIAIGILPQALVVGLSRSQLPRIEWLWLVAGVVAAGVCLLLEYQSRRSDAVLMIAMVLGITLFKSKSFVMPVLDRAVSARPFYQLHVNWLEGACLQEVGRDAAYGLQYYAGREFPACPLPAAVPRIMEVSGRLVLVD